MKETDQPLAQLYLSRLKKADRWVELGRAHGFVTMQGAYPNGTLRVMDFDEPVLIELIKEGSIELDASQRIQNDPMTYPERQREVTQKYWRVVT